MNKAILAAALALAGPALAQSDANRSFTGAALLYTPSRVDGCQVTISQAQAFNGQISLTLRNAGSSPVEFTLSGELSAAGQSFLSNVTVRLAGGQDVRVALMRTPSVPLANSTLGLRSAACTLQPG